MGEVYRARDTRLGRDVAIKVLPSHLSDSLDLKARFEREARAVAALSHPHICAIHDVGSQDGVEYLVMELLEGQTLAERLEKGPLPTDQVLKFGMEIADALDKAHRHGIVHRDLKPGNVMLTKSGVKLLDFGLAKTLAPGRAEGLSSLPTEAERPLTEKGTIMGTFQYMAPEQLEGKEADARTDIFSFGCVLYEMATGRKAFTGKSRVSLIGSILKDEPPLISSIAPMAPPALDHVVRRCLAKEADDRWQSAADVASELRWVGEAGSQAGAPAVVGLRRKNRERLAWAVAAVVAILLAVVSILLWNSSNRQQAALRVHFNLPKGERLVALGGNSAGFAISPDGSKIAYLVLAGATSKLRLHSMDRNDSTELPGTETAGGPFFSPDGKWIGFFDPIGLKKVAIAGGSPVPIAPTSISLGGAWGTDGFIYFVPDVSTGIFRVPEAGGVAVPVTRVRASEGEIQHRWPDVLPGEKTIVYTAGFGKDWDEAKIVAERLDTGERKVVVNGGTSPRYLPGGYLVYARAGSLYAVAFNARSLSTSGSPVEVAHDVGFILTGRSLFDFSRTGILASVSQDDSGASSILSWIDRGGHAETTKIEIQDLDGGSLSPDGSRAVVQIGNSVAIVDLARLTLRKLTLSARANGPIWSADGTKIFFALEKDKFYKPFSKAADDSGEEKPLFPAETGEFPAGVFRDGSRVLIWHSNPGGEKEIRIRTIGRSDTGQVLVKSRTLDQSARLSPDEKWLAYTTVDSGRAEVYVRPISGVDQNWQISTEGGGGPIWSRSGKEIFYGSGTRLMAVPVEAGASFSYGAPKLLFDNPEVWTLDIAPDGQRFLGSKDPNFGAGSKISITTGWFSEIERKLREAKAP